MIARNEPLPDGGQIAQTCIREARLSMLTTIYDKDIRVSRWAGARVEPSSRSVSTPTITRLGIDEGGVSNHTDTNRRALENGCRVDSVRVLCYGCRTQ